MNPNPNQWQDPNQPSQYGNYPPPAQPTGSYSQPGQGSYGNYQQGQFGQQYGQQGNYQQSGYQPPYGQQYNPPPVKAKGRTFMGMSPKVAIGLCCIVIVGVILGAVVLMQVTMRDIHM